MPRAAVLCLAATLLWSAPPVLAQEAAAPAAPPAAPPAVPPQPAAATASPAASGSSATDDEAGRKRRDAATDRRAMFEARLAALHAGLLLTPEQEKLWPGVDAAIRGFAAMRIDQRDERADRLQDAADHAADGEVPDEDPVAALKEYSDRLLRRAQSLKAVADSADPLWATMTEDQKRRLPRLLAELNPNRPPHDARRADRQDGERRWRRADDLYRDEPRGRDAWHDRDRMSDDEAGEPDRRHPREADNEDRDDDRW